jgi:hypothetical protein
MTTRAIKNHSLQLLLALVLALVLPISSMGAVAGNPFLAPSGQLAPSGNPSPLQTPHEEEDEHPVGAKVACAKSLTKKQRRCLFTFRVSILPSLAVDTKQCAPTYNADDSENYRLPSTVFLTTALAHRGPPAA